MAVMKKKDITRRDIISSAQDVFIEKGYAATSMDDLRLRADVSKGTLYYHFTNKEGLFLACLNASTRAFYVHWLELSNQAEGAAEKLYLLGDYYAQHAPRSLANATFEYMTAASSEDFSSNRSLFTLIQPEYKMFERVLREGIQTGEFKPSLPIDSVILALYTSFTTLGTAQSLRKNSGASSSRMIRDLVTSMIHGIK